MSELIPLISEYSVVEIPEDATKCWLSVGHLGTSLWADKKMDYGDWMESLPPGNYELIGISSEITKKQVDKIVEEIKGYPHEPKYYKVYYSDEDPAVIGTTDWLKSFQSLLISKGLKGRYAILKTIK